MKSITIIFTMCFLFSVHHLFSAKINPSKNPKTKVAIVGEKFFINGKPTFENRKWEGYDVEGLLPNSRMVQGIFDDLNPETAIRWDYPDGKWDAERNTSEFVEAMAEWRAHGLLAFTLNLQGGSPMGYGNRNWHNSAFDENGNLRPDYMKRLEKILNKADELAMVPILGLFYFGQDQNLKDETAIKRAVDNTMKWLRDKKFGNVLIEVGNESNNGGYDHAILKENRVHELIGMIKDKFPGFLVSTSFNGNTLPPEKVLEISDYVLIHGNGVHNPDRITEMVQQVRAMISYTPKPIVFNEDDHFDFDLPVNNYVNAIKERASWGYFDYRMQDEDFNQGFQSVPVNWKISSARKKGFFNKTKEIFID